MADSRDIQSLLYNTIYVANANTIIKYNAVRIFTNTRNYNTRV